MLAAFGPLAAAIEHHHARTQHRRTDVADLRDVNSAWRSSTTPGARG